MHSGRNAGLTKNVNDLLPAAQRIPNKGRYVPICQTSARKPDNTLRLFLTVQKHVEAQPECRFDDQAIAKDRFRRIATKSPAQLDISRVDQPLAAKLHQQLRGPENVTGRISRQYRP